jgi:hypothetical protein
MQNLHQHFFLDTNITTIYKYKIKTASSFAFSPCCAHGTFRCFGVVLNYFPPFPLHVVGGGLAWLQAPLPHKGIPPVLTILLCSLKLHDIWVMLLKGLSHEIDFKNVDENGQILALIRAAAGF